MISTISKPHKLHLRADRYWWLTLFSLKGHLCLTFGSFWGGGYQQQQQKISAHRLGQRQLSGSGVFLSPIAISIGILILSKETRGTLGEAAFDNGARRRFIYAEAIYRVSMMC